MREVFIEAHTVCQVKTWTYGAYHSVGGEEKKLVLSAMQ